MAVGRPISLTPNVATKTLSSTATADQTSFTVTGGYRINELGVYRNGVRLVQGKDFTASDGSTVTLLSGATVDDIIDFVIFDSFNIADAINTVGNQTISGELTATKFIGDGGGLTGVGTANINTNNIAISGIATVGTSITMRDGAINVTGVVTATSFSGDISNTTGIQTAYIDAASITSSGIVSVTNTTASTSSATGALIVSGGVGIAGSLHVGENVSVGGTLTYEDVTNIDSVGIITAQTGVKVTAGGVDITAGGLNITAGVSTFTNNVTTLADFYLTSAGIGGTNVSWDSSEHKLLFSDNAELTFGAGEDLTIYHSGSNSFITDGGVGNLYIQGSNVSIRGTNGESGITFNENAGVTILHDNSTKFATSPTGGVVTGILTATSDLMIGTKSAATTGKAIAMAMVFG